MTNEQRRAALTKARKKALEWAEETESPQSVWTPKHAAEMARMWSDVAQALKIGDSVADSVTYAHEQH